MTGNVKKNLDDADEISRLLGGMPRVGIPANFDAGVKRRIAEARSRQARWWPVSFAPGFAVAAIGILLIGVLFIYWTNGRNARESISISTEKHSISEAENTNSEDLGQNTPHKEMIAESRSFDNGKPTGTEMAGGSGKTDARPPDKRTQKIRRANREGGSVTRALRANAERTFPGGVRPSPAGEAGDGIDIPAALSRLGIQSRFDSGWQVVRVFQNSAAAVSGVQEGDVIEAINDNAVDQSSRIPVRQPIEKLSLRRNGQALVVEITFK